MGDVPAEEAQAHLEEAGTGAHQEERRTLGRATELAAPRHPPVQLSELVQRWSELPEVDPAVLRLDIAAALDPSV